MPVERRWPGLGVLLRGARLQGQLSQQFVARHVDLSRSGYAMMERGELRPRPEHLGPLAQVLNLECETLARLAGYRAESSAVEYFLVALYQSKYKTLITLDRSPLSVAPLVSEIACPRCGGLFVAERSPADSRDFSAIERTALTLMDEECPDHAHRFSVDNVRDAPFSP